MKFIHLTDTHLMPPGKLLVGLDPIARFTACIDSIIQDHSDASCCVITGDLTHHSDPAAYAVMAEQLARCPMPCHLVAGNHDNRELMGQAFSAQRFDSNGFVQYVEKTDAGVFVMLDTLVPGSASGGFCNLRQEWLQQALREHSDQPVFLFMHHPPFDLHFPAIDQLGLQEKAEFEAIVKPHQNIRHLFFGHAHRPVSGTWNGISFSTLRGTNHQIELQFRDTNIQYIDEPPEYSVVFIGDQQIVIHTQAYKLASGK